MPSSRPNAIPSVISLVRQIDPESILDVGVGFGKWGVLFREYTDIIKSESEPSRYKREKWKVRIEGVEGFTDYITPMHHFVYDAIHLGDVLDVLPTLGKYDLIFMGDIIEHLEKEKGDKLIRLGLEHTNRYLIISTPRFETHQPVLLNNELEKHRSLWTIRDFKDISRSDVIILPGEILLAVYPRPGQPRIIPEKIKPKSPARMFAARTGRNILGEKLYNIIRAKIPF